MIQLIHEEGEYWLKKDSFSSNQKFIGVIDNCTKQELLSLAKKINKEFGVVVEHCGEPKCPSCNKKAYDKGYKDGFDYFKNEVEEDKKKFLQGFAYKAKK